MRNLLILAGLVAVLAGCATEPKPGELPSIRVIRTWRDLLDQPEIGDRPKDGAIGAEQIVPTIRLGIETTSCRLHDGVLIYALTRGYAPPEEFSGLRDRNTLSLGPVRVAVTPLDRPAGPKYAADMEKAHMHNRFPAGDCRLFVAPIVGYQPGRMRVTVLNSAGVALAQCDFAVVDKPAYPWTLWTLDTKPVDELAKRFPGDPEDLAVDYVRPRLNGIVVPNWTDFGDWPMFTDVQAEGRSVKFAIANGKVTTADAASLLPRFCPDKVDPGLKLTAGKGELTVESDRDILVCRPDWHFLARWWINGKPFTPRPMESFGDQNGKVIEGRHLRLKVAIDRAALGAAKGDRIDVQLLYCEHGWRFAEEQSEMLSAWHRSSDWPEPRLTNRVQWIDAP